MLFITHDLEEAISLSDRVIVLSAGPETHPIGEFAIDLPRPRDVAEIRMQPRFVELHEAIWQVLEIRGAERAMRKAASEPADQPRDAGVLPGAAAVRPVRPVVCADRDRASLAPFFFGKPLKVLHVIWEWFSERQDLPAPRHHADRDDPRVRGGQPVSDWNRSVACAVADGIRARRSLHQGAERDAARDPGADLRRVVRTGRSRRRSRWA